MSRLGYRFSALILVFIASLAWTLSSGGASAGTATGAPRYYTVNGISYMSGAAVMTSPGKVSAMVEAGCRRRSNVRPVAPVENWATVVVSLCRVVGSG